MAAVSIRPATERDYPSIARIQQECPEAAQWPVGDYSNYNVLLASVGAAAAGFCAWRRVAPGEAELLNLAVAPAWRRLGIATALLNRLREDADGDIFLEVAANNEAAIRLYGRHGWERTGVRPAYYEGGRTSAIVMKKSSW